MILLIIYIILFLIFLKINKDEKKNDTKETESFYNLNERIRNCSNCRCKYYDNNQSGTYSVEEMALIDECEESECGQYVPGELQYQEAVEGSETINDPMSSLHGESECNLCFPKDAGEPDNAREYNVICANPRRLQACFCGVKGLCSPCQEDFDKAHIYALQNMCTNRGYIWKYSSGARGKTRGYVWDCLHTKETCIKESLKVLRHPENDPEYKTSDKYYEWDDSAGVCTYGNPYIRNMCEGENRFWYDARGAVKGGLKCHMTQDYCNKYAQDGFKNHDCFVYFGQMVAENAFNTIGVRCARIDCGVKGCPHHHPPAYGKDDIDIREPGYGKLNCDWNVKRANCSREFMWDRWGPSRKLTENASELIPWNNENSVCNGVPTILSTEQKERDCTL
jgi:hypothetical protein